MNSGSTTGRSSSNFRDECVFAISFATRSLNYRLAEPEWVRPPCLWWISVNLYFASANWEGSFSTTGLLFCQTSSFRAACQDSTDREGRVSLSSSSFFFWSQWCVQQGVNLLVQSLCCGRAPGEPGLAIWLRMRAKRWCSSAIWKLAISGKSQRQTLPLWFSNRCEPTPCRRRAGWYHSCS